MVTKAHLATAANARTATAAILVAGWLATLWISWPGHLSYDSIVQLHDGRVGFYHSWHPPVMAWLLGILGPGLFVVLDASLAFGALLLLAWNSPRASWWGAGAAAIAVLLPQLVLYQAIVWKDVLFADATVAGFACLAMAERRWHPGWAVAGFALFAVAALTRQTGAVVPLFGAVALSRIAPRRKLIHAAAALAATALVVLGANAMLDRRSDHGEGPVAQLRLLRLYDLVGAVAADPSLPLDRLKDDAPELERLIRSDGVKLYSPERNDTLVGSQALQNELADTAPELMAAQWYDLVFHHTALYLKVRARVFAHVLFTPDIVGCRPVFVGVEGPPGEMSELGIAPRLDGRDVALRSYAQAFMGTPAFSHVFFAVAGLLALVPLWRLGKRALAFLLIASFAFTASFFAISIACDYRYLYVLDLAVIAAWLYLFQVLAMWVLSFWLERSPDRKS
ncbi:MAG: hypothetical protein JOZ72_07045 [Alphaproteobacteria bacterium]|nr:hypothetical protein [Alphaproteobacteria bacterium]